MCIWYFYKMDRSSEKCNGKIAEQYLYNSYTVISLRPLQCNDCHCARLFDFFSCSDRNCQAGMPQCQKDLEEHTCNNVWFCHHIYKENWSPFTNEHLIVQHEDRSGGDCTILRLLQELCHQYTCMYVFTPYFVCLEPSSTELNHYTLRSWLHMTSSIKMVYREKWYGYTKLCILKYGNEQPLSPFICLPIITVHLVQQKQLFHSMIIA